MTTVTQVLRHTYTLIKGGWVKSSFHSFKSENDIAYDCYCLDGAVRQAVCGVPNVNTATKEQKDLLTQVEKALAKAIDPKSRRDAQESIISFNDADKTKKADVLAVIAKAMKAA